MKTKITIHLATLLIILCPTSGKCQAAKSNVPLQDSTINSGRFFWGEINGGYSNNGPAGSLTVNFRTGRFLFGTRYFKSHTCYRDNKKREYFLNDGSSDNHMTVESISAFSGIFFKGKWTPSLSIGVSWCRFKYSSTECIEHEVTLPRIWDTVMNKDYVDETLSSRTINTIGIPVELKLHFAPKHFVGFDAGLKAEVNMHSAFVSAEVGIRFGRVMSRHTNLY